MAARSAFKAFGLCLLWLSLITEVWATTRYVRTTGSNSYTCAQSTSVDTAKQTIAAGLDCMSAGDTLIIKAGTYNESIAIGDIPSGISDGQRTIIQAASGETVTLTGHNSQGYTIQIYDRSYITIDGINIYHGQTRIGATQSSGLPGTHYVTIKNATIDCADTGQPIGNRSCMSTGGISGAAHTHILYQNLEVKNAQIGNPDGSLSGHGIYPSALSDSIIENCYVHDNYSMGIQQYSSATVSNMSNNIFRNNRVTANGSHGMLIGFGSGNLIYNNIIWGNGIHLSGSSALIVQGGTIANTKIYNNTLYDHTGSYGIRIATGTGAIIRNNISYSNDGPEISNAGTSTSYSNNLCDAKSGPCTLGGNPLFVSASDFHLQQGSPAIGAGVTLTEFSTDFAGVSRPQGTGWDLGAYEYTTPASITLLGPIGGENWQVGSSQTFTWSTVSTSENVDILLSRNGTFSDTETLFNNLSDDGSETWTVAGSTTTTAKARARLHATTSIYSTSAAAFSISASVTGTITVTEPPSGLHVFPTGSLGITWTYEGVSGNCQIQLSRDGGVTWETVSASVPISQGSYVYTVPVGSAYSLCVVKVTSLQDTNVSGTSSEFRIGGTYLIIK